MCTCVFMKRGETEFFSETPQLVTLNLLDHTHACGHTHTHSIKSMALVSVHTWCCTNIPQHISVRQETTTHMQAIRVCVHTHTNAHTFIIFSGVWLKLCACLKATPLKLSQNTLLLSQTHTRMLCLYPG